MSQKIRLLMNIKTYAVVALLLVATQSTAAIYESDELNGIQPGLLEQEASISDAFESILPDQVIFDTPFEHGEEDVIKREFIVILQKIRQKKYQEASDQVQQLIKRRPDVVQSYVLKALVELRQKDKVSALESFNKALEMDGNNQGALLGIASIYYEEGRVKETQEFIQKAIAVNKKSVGTYLFWADIAKNEGNYVEVEIILKSGLENVKGQIADEARVISQLAKLYARQGHPHKVLLLAEDLNSRYPDHLIALSILSGAQLVNNQMNEAERTLRRLIALDTKDIQHRIMLSNLLANQSGKVDEVLSIIGQIKALAPKSIRVMVQEANLLIRIKRFEDALNVAKGISSLAPEVSLGKAIEGDVYYAQKKYDQAYMAYKEAYKASENPKLLTLMVDILNLQSKQNDAITLLMNELKKNDKNLTAHYRLAILLQQQNELNNAEKHYKAILALQPNNPLALNNLAWLYSQQNNPKALELAENAMNLAPNSGDVADTLGMILSKQGQTQKAIDVLERAVKLKPTDSDIKYHLANVYVVTGNNKRAIELLEIIVKDGDEFESKNQAVQLLSQLKRN